MTVRSQSIPKSCESLVENQIIYVLHGLHENYTNAFNVFCHLMRGLKRK